MGRGRRTRPEHASRTVLHRSGRDRRRLRSKSLTISTGARSVPRASLGTCARRQPGPTARQRAQERHSRRAAKGARVTAAPAVERAARQLDPENPWPGLDSFEEHTRDFFHGRDAEAEELLRRVIDAPLTVLFGKSGLGKTSLLKAGLFPRLRERHFLPIHVRLDIRAGAGSLAAQIRDALAREIVA